MPSLLDLEGSRLREKDSRDCDRTCPRTFLGERRTRAGRGLAFDVSIRGWCVEKKTGLSDLIGHQLSVAFLNSASAHSVAHRK